MSKRVYISADYSISNGDREVIDVLHRWSEDNRYKADYVDTAEVVSGSVSKNSDCRACDLKHEFNRQINASSYVIFVVGDKTAEREAGNGCQRKSKQWFDCTCTPYKQNANGAKQCKVYNTISAGDDIGSINSYSYLQHEWEQAVKKKKGIIIFYNSLYKEASWLPSYMKEYENVAVPFWVKNTQGDKIGNYEYLKEALGY